MKAEFEAEVLPHLDALYRMALRMLQDPSKAGDAVQETCLAAWRSFDRYQRGTNCKAWLFAILMNKVRHERRRWMRWVLPGDEGFEGVIAPEPVPESITDGEIAAALDGLSAEHREIVLLVDVEEFQYGEAAAVLGIAPGTVMSRLSRARAQLRKRLR